MVMLGWMGFRFPDEDRTAAVLCVERLFKTSSD